MSEFKFSCPSCGQRIQVTDAYSGRQINCPACDVLILVPQPPGVPPVIPRAAMPSPGSFPDSSGQRSSFKWVLIGGAGLAVLAAVAAVLVFGMLPRRVSGAMRLPDARSTAQDNAHASASARSQDLSASEIVRKVAERYGSLTSYSAAGTAISEVDMSGVDPKNLPGMDKLPADAKNSPQFQQAMQRGVRTESEFSVKLGRPAFYRVEWNSKAGPAAMKGAVWSAGEGDFLALADTKYSRLKNRQMALASAAGASGGAAGTLPGIFFEDQTSLLNFFKQATLGEDDTVDGEKCYVLNGDAAGTKLAIWVSKSSFLIKQKQTVLGGKSTMPEISEAQAERAVRKAGNLAPEQVARAKAAMKSMKPLLAQMKGTLTETYRDIEINQPVRKEAFDHELPPGAVLSKSVF